VNKNCPSCGTPFNVSPQDEGKQFNCFKCNTALTVTRTGLHAVGSSPVVNLPKPPSAPVVNLPMAEEAPPERPAASPLDPLFAFFRALPDLPTWLFGIGMFIVIPCLFLPALSAASAKRAAAKVELGQLKMDRLEKEFKAKSNPTVAEADNQKKMKESWDKEKETLESAAKEADLEARASDYWYTFGMMFGFLFLAVASLGYLDPRQPTIRRAVGAVVLVAQILLIFTKFTGSGGILKALLG
jgi:hypothetical protein